jgi:hypothetical protein
MPRFKKLFLLVLALCGALLCSIGCSTKTEQESTIPWSRPANWEGGIPGMGGMGR